MPATDLRAKPGRILHTGLVYDLSMTDLQTFTPFDETNGLIFALVLPGSPEEFEDSRRGWDRLTTSGGSGPLWIHLDRTKERAQQWVRTESGLDPLTAEDLLAEETRPRGEEVSGELGGPEGLLVFLRGIDMNPGAEPDELISIRMWLEQDRLITLREQRFQTIALLRKRAMVGKAPATPGAFLVAVARGLTERLGASVTNLEEMLDDIEEEMLDQDSDNENHRTKLATIRRQAIAYRRYLLPQREAFSSVVNGTSKVLTPRDKAELRAILEQTIRVSESLEELRDRAAVTQDELRARHEARVGRTVYMLTIVATVMLPLGFVTGLFGINVGGLPLEQTQWGFAAVCVVMLFIAVAELLWFKRKRML